MEQDDFNQWKENPVTRWVLGALEIRANQCEEVWREYSWVGGKADPLALAELRTRADALRTIADATFEGVKEVYEDSTD